ncbi:hypothetical protein TNCT_90261 [Trichonephila clavata]|uniref:Uncharacterized protein n=1 Tax=Trichonephila clavata TaxID=2740835 RepID=A0A8X6HTH6_TRICU|nr:hypothetical protein TNCT_90261 [Trichonephila clavata]
MYTGQLKVTCQELSDVYRSARKLGMKGAIKECVENTEAFFRSQSDFLTTAPIITASHLYMQRDIAWVCNLETCQFMRLLDFVKVHLT